MLWNKGNPWRSVAASVTGASHVRKWLREHNREYDSIGEFENDAHDVKALNQDRVNVSHGTTEKKSCLKANPTVIAVSDGHGGAKYIRSGIGAEFAVLSACRVATLNHSNIMRGADIDQVVSHMKTRFLDSWLTDVDDYTASNPFQEEELSALNESARKDLQENPRKAYGCTALWVIGYDDMVISFQLGDGNIVLLYEDGRVESTTDLSIHEPGEETASLCTTKSSHEILHQVFRSNEKGDGLPVLVAISSDGLYKSYENNDDFLKIPQICLDTLKENDFNHEQVESTIRNFLQIVTDKGAGDDTTLGVMYNFQKVYSKSKTLKKAKQAKSNARGAESNDK